MRNKKIFLLIMIGVLILLGKSDIYASTDNNGTVVFSPNPNDTYDDSGVTYVRMITLKHNGSNNGMMLCVFDQQIVVDGQGVWPVYRSIDSGETWQHVTDIRDNEHGTTHKMNPCIYELPQDVGELKEGTILVAGLLVPDDWSESQITIFKSTDLGNSFGELGIVDVGGAIEYDASPESTTSTIWEPYLMIDGRGRLACYYSDEREKSEGVLQALVYRSSWDGVNWGTKTNVVAVPNKSDRPGMITVTKMGNGKYLAAYEVVNRPSRKVDTAVCYYKISDDGINWNPTDLGTPVLLEDGTGCGSAPFVKWIDAGGPNGMVIVVPKWQVDENGYIRGGQNFFVNYNYGEGVWERLPMAVTFDGPNIENLLSGFSGSIDVSMDGKTLYQAANVENLISGRNEVRVGSIPLNAAIYEAENAQLTNVVVDNYIDASNGKKVGYINYEDSCISFQKIAVPVTGTYTINVRYTNGTGNSASHKVSVNGGSTFELQYPACEKWGRYLWKSFTCTLQKGENTISFSKGNSFTELDCIQVSNENIDLSNQFVLENRNSGKLLEIANAAIDNNVQATQYEWTNYNCQLWRISKKDINYIQLENVNSGKMLEIQGAANNNGAFAVQYDRSGNYCQDWCLLSTSNGYYKLINRNSNKLLEVQSNLTSNGANIGQWDDTGYSCQEWKLKREGMK